MPTAYASAQSVKSVSQRALVCHWNRLAAGRRFPAFTEFELEPGMHDPKQLVVWNIEGRGPQLKFRALYQGENVAEVFSSAWAGKTMDQVVPMSLRRVALDAAKECVASGCAIYTIISTIDTNDHRVDCERLLLPFGRNGSGVEQILASLQLTSVSGAVHRKKILNSFQMQADVLFFEKIESGFTRPDPASTDAAIDASATYPEPNQPSQILKLDAALSGQADAATRENRRASRRDIVRSGRISFAGESKSCMVRNISATGAAIEVGNLNETPDSFTLTMEMETAARPCTVVWRKKTQIGVRFG
jgi:hypothetical protein